MRRALGELAGRDAGGEPTEAVLERLEDPRFEMLLAMDGSTAVGQGALLQVGPVAAIYGVYVEPGCRGRGIARAILGELVTLARRLELRTVVLEVEEDNHAALALYDACGFAVAGETVRFCRPRGDEPCPA
jgi:ribosomal protein S18 acetylase RimI-like enzyme